MQLSPHVSGANCDLGSNASLAFLTNNSQCRSTHRLLDPGRLRAAEDSGNHENNVAWYYDLEAKTLARYFSSPVGAEVVSPYYYPNINGFAYILTGAQHPFAGQEDRLCVLSACCLAACGCRAG